MTMIVVAAILTLSQPPSAAPSPAALDPCALLTKQDATAAVGEAVGEPQKIAPGRSSMPGVTVVACEYVAASRNSIKLILWRPFGDSAAMFMQVYKSGCMKKEQVAGLGDLACWHSKEHRELQVLKGGTLLTFEINRNGNATEALITAAKNTLPRVR